MKRKKLIRLLWQASLVLGILLELALIGFAVHAAFDEDRDFEPWQQVLFVAVVVWIYIAYLKQRALDISAHVVDEKIKTHSLVEHLPEGVILLSPENRILLMNPKACELTGLQELECLEGNLASRVDTNTARFLTAGSEGEVEASFASSGRAVRLSVKHLACKTGDPHKLLRVNPAKQPEPESHGGQDINESIRVLLSKAVSSLAQALTGEERNSADVAKVGLMALGAARRLQMLDAAAAAKKASATGKIPLRPLLEELAKEISPFSETLGVTIDLSKVRDGAVSGEQEILKSAIGEVLLNALLGAGGSGQVSIQMAEMGQNVGVSIIDSGPAIKKERLNDIFSDSYSGALSPDNRPCRTDGMGLGVARKTIEAGGGSMWAESPENGGLRVTVMLPG